MENRTGRDSLAFATIFQEGHEDEEDDSPRLALVRGIRAFSKEQKSKLYGRLEEWERGYTIGFMKVTLDFVFVLRIPEHYWVWHCLKALFFLPSVFIRFRRRNQEWYMLDFCYFNAYYTLFLASLVVLRVIFGVETIFHQYNSELVRLFFVISNGALALSVPLFGNKIVFHDVDNTASIFIHFSPAVCAWSVRWGGGFGTARVEEAWPTVFAVCGGDEHAGSFQGILSYFWSPSEACSFTANDFIVHPTAYWLLCWGLPYYLIGLYCLRGYLDRNNKTTLYSQTIEEPKGAGWFTLKAPASVWRECFMLQHFAWTMVSGLLSFWLWNSFALHSLYLIAIFVYAFHNGSTYIFRVVAARHVHQEVETQFEEQFDFEEEEIMLATDALGAAGASDSE